MVTDFDFFSGDRVLVAAGSEFRIRQVGADLQVSADFGSLTLQNVDGSMIALSSLVQKI